MAACVTSCLQCRTRELGFVVSMNLASFGLTVTGLSIAACGGTVSDRDVSTSDARAESESGSTSPSGESGPGTEDADCTTGTSRCSGAQPQTCNEGVWLDNGAACSGATSTCLSGMCVAPGGASDAGPSSDSAVPFDSATSGEIDAAIFDGPLPDSSGSPVETFDVIDDGVALQPLACPSSHWEFPLQSDGSVTLRNTGSVPLAYIAQQNGWEGGVQYTPGVPTSGPGEEVGVLAPGATAILTANNGVSNQYVIALIGASKPFSIYDGGFAAADEWTMPWPLGVQGSGGSSTMYVAELSFDSTCSAVVQP
jgi:hypothetical protein